MSLGSKKPHKGPNLQKLQISSMGSKKKKILPLCFKEPPPKRAANIEPELFKVKNIEPGLKEPKIKLRHKEHQILGLVSKIPKCEPGSKSPKYWA